MRKLLLASAVSVGALITLGCGSTVRKPSAGFFMPQGFLPSESARAAAEDSSSGTPAADVAPTSESRPESSNEERPKPEQSLLASSMPLSRVSRDSGWQSTRFDLAIQQAQMRLESGRRFQQEGQLGRARAEYDAALDQLLALKPESPFEKIRLERVRESMVDRIYRFDLEAQDVTQASDDESRRFVKAPLEEILTTTFPVDPSLRMKVQEELAMTTSELPLQLADPVVSFIQYFSSEAGRKKLIFGLKRQGRYRQMISRILAEEGLPQELIYLAQAESAFLPRAKSWASAVGMWQFMSYTGKMYGLQQSPYADDRMDPEKATRAAARHLKDLYNAFGDWYLAIAAYNCGQGCVESAVARTGYADFWELRARRAVPLETTNYVPIIVAFAIMLKNADKYELEGIVEDDPLRCESITLDANTHLGVVAGLTGRTQVELEEMNPALLGPVAPAGYTLNVPEGTVTQLSALEKIPANLRASARVYRATEGDTLAAVAQKFNASQASLKVLDREESAELSSGDLVIVPVYQAPVVRYKWVKRGGKSVRVAVSTGQTRTVTASRVGKGQLGKGKTAANRRSTTKVKSGTRTARPKAAATVAKRR